MRMPQICANKRCRIHKVDKVVGHSGPADNGRRLKAVKISFDKNCSHMEEQMEEHC